MDQSKLDQICNQFISLADPKVSVSQTTAHTFSSLERQTENGQVYRLHRSKKRKCQERRWRRRRWDETGQGS